MNESIGLFAITLFMLITVFFTGYFLQETSRKGVFFGVRVPAAYMGSEEVKGILRRYKKSFLISFIIYAVIYLALMCMYPNPGVMIIGILAFIIVLNVNYYKTHKEIKLLKGRENWVKDSKNVIIVDTEFRKSKDKKMVVSKWWFIIPVVLIIFNVIIALVRYPNLPDVLPRHWNGKGVVDGWSNKSYLLVLALPIVETLLTGIMFGMYTAIGRAKQDLDSENIEASKERSRRFRRFWSAFAAGMACFIAADFTMLQLNTLAILKTSPTFMIVSYVFEFGIVIVVVIGSLLIGQGGSRIKVIENKNGEKIAINRDDDKYWKLGDFYYNPDDPALFVEKRVGIGWDFNYARPAAKIIMGFIAILIIGVIVLAIAMITK